jgi:O-antigen ligase
MRALERIRRVFSHVGVVGCVLLGFAIPTSRPLFNIAALLIIFGWVFSGHFQDKWNTLRRNPLWVPVAGLCAMLLLGATYTSAPWAHVVEHWDRYSKFLLLLMVISLLTEQRQRRWMWFSFIAACCVVLVSTYLNIFFRLPWSKTQTPGWGVDHSVFIDYIAQSLVMGLFASVLWFAALRARSWPWRAFFLTLCFAALVSITHLTSSRIGYGVVLALVVVIPLLSLPLRWAIAAVGFGLLAALATLLFSDLVSFRVQQVVSEASSYQRGELFTSTGARLHMWVTSFDLWMQAPWIGHGTGAYHSLAKAAFANDLMCQIGCFHPHNQFLFFAVDHGWVGVILLSAYMITAGRMAWRREICEKGIFMAFLVIFFIDALAHGPLWLFMEAYFSFGIMALLASGHSGLFDFPNQTTP